MNRGADLLALARLFPDSPTQARKAAAVSHATAVRTLLRTALP
jgi:hypothetical protein